MTIFKDRMIIEKWDSLRMAWIDYEFKQESEEGYTVQGRHLETDRLEWIHKSQIRITDREVDPDKPKPKSWTIGEEIPEHLIKKKKRGK